jgi:hypothetical protein
MSTDPSNPNFAFGSPRSAPRPEFSDPRPLQRQPVGSISSPAGPTQESVTTGSRINQAGRGNRKGRGASGLSAPGMTAGPDLGIDSGSAQEIIDASGVQKAYDKVDTSAAERMSDADPERNPVTPATAPDSPLLTRIRAKLSSSDYFQD